MKWIITTSVIGTRTYVVEADSKDAARLHFVAESAACRLVSQEDDNEEVLGIAPDFEKSASA